jgi:hypothetical protein
LDRLPLSLSSQPKGDLEREIIDLEREIVVGGRVGLHLGCLHLVHRHGSLRLCLCSHRGQMNGDKLLIVLVRRAVLGTNRAELGIARAVLGTFRAELGTISAELGTIRAELGTISAELGTIRAELGTGRLRLPIIAQDDVLRPEPPRGALPLLARRAELGTVRAELGTRRADVPQLLPASAMDAALATSGGAVGGAVVGAIGGSFPDLFTQDGA